MTRYTANSLLPVQKQWQRTQLGPARQEGYAQAQNHGPQDDLLATAANITSVMNAA